MSSAWVRTGWWTSKRRCWSDFRTAGGAPARIDPQHLSPHMTALIRSRLQEGPDARQLQARGGRDTWRILRTVTADHKLECWSCDPSSSLLAPLARIQ